MISIIHIRDPPDGTEIGQQDIVTGCLHRETEYMSACIRKLCCR